MKRITALILALLMLSACAEKRQNYIIGVSQCSEDAWRKKLKEELIIATYFNPNVELIFTSANDDSRQQERQIDSLVSLGIDLLIVSPNQVELLSDKIDRAYDSGIPVILFDRKTNSSKYTAYMGTDNFNIGEMMGHYLAGVLGHKGTIAEIGGLPGSSPAAERHNGFAHALSSYPQMQLVGFAAGDWTRESGYRAMKEILGSHRGKIDAVFGGNDRMAIGARDALRESGRDRGEIIYLGVDALPGKDEGISQVADSLLFASAMYPTHGDELMLLALDILQGREYSRENIMKSSIVNADNAEVLLLQHEEVVRQAHYLDTMHQQAGQMQDSMKLQQTIIGLVLLLATAVSIMLSIYVRAYRQKKQFSHRLQQEMEKVARQRDELEEQRDQLIELSVGTQEGEDEGEQASPNSRREFMQRFNSAVEKSLSDPDVSVEDISAQLCMSRAQLYRKVKAITGKSPMEIIRQLRLSKADRLLSETSMNISEIAYSVGFSSASYFSKCYRDFFNRLPTEVKRP